MLCTLCRPLPLGCRAGPPACALAGRPAAIKLPGHRWSGSRVILQNRRGATLAATGPNNSETAEDENLFEPARKVQARARREPKVKVSAPLVEAVNAGEITPEGQLEGYVLSILALLFIVILGEGLLVAGSGFLSDENDKLIQDVVLPAFTPTVGIFLTVSSGYGFWKTRDNSSEPKK